MESRHNKYPREENEFWSTLEVDFMKQALSRFNYA